MRVWLSELVAAAVEREPDPAFEGVSDDALVEGFSQQASAITAQTCRWLLALAEIVRRGIWVASALAGRPGLTARFSTGEISYSKVRAITRYGHP